MTHEFIVSGNGTVMDTATLYKNHTCGMKPSNYTGTNSTTPISDENGSSALKASSALLVVVVATVLMLSM
ncbi:hypothetical protein V1507DRAFT_469679 [Lipomyces tetrasporus]